MNKQPLELLSLLSSYKTTVKIKSAENTFLELDGAAEITIEGEGVRTRSLLGVKCGSGTYLSVLAVPLDSDNLDPSIFWRLDEFDYSSCFHLYQDILDLVSEEVLNHYKDFGEAISEGVTIVISSQEVTVHA